MIKQFFGREYGFLLALSVAMFVDAILSYAFHLGAVTLAIYFIAILILAYKRLEWAIVFAFLELFTNPHGKLIFTTIADQTLSIRMVIFAAIMLAWVVLFLQKSFVLDLARLKPFLVLVVAVGLGFIGLLANHPVAAFQDGNAYLYLLYLLPIISIQWNASSKRLLLQCLAAGATWIVILSLGSLYLYSHFAEFQLETTYTFLRDVRIAEITGITASIYRVFIQSQFFVVVFAMMCVGLLFEKQNVRTNRILVLLLSPAVAIVTMGLSRSFWIGVVFALVTSILLLAFSIRPRLKDIAGLAGKSIASIVIGLLILASIVLFPFPERSSSIDLADALRNRADSDVAVSSRWKLLEPMLATIAEAPLLGSGFGKTVTFKTDDPRVRASSPDGTWETYSMEWGWLELWIKMGIFGPLGFLFLAAFLVQAFIVQLSTEHRWLAVGFLTSITFLYGTHVFSPYLNHPIGLGFLLFAYIFAQPTIRLGTPVMEKVRASLVQKKNASPALTLNKE